jgi:hypothetical protein
MPFHFTPEQREALSKRLLVQPPPSMEAVAAHAYIAKQLRTIENIPIDVLECLEALRLLADDGNIAAQEIYMAEREKFGIAAPRHFGL